MRAWSSLEDSDLPASYTLIARSNKGLVECAASLLKLSPPLAGATPDSSPTPPAPPPRVSIEFVGERGLASAGVLSLLEMLDDVYALYANNSVSTRGID